MFDCLDVSYFSEALLKYNNEHQMAKSIKESRNIGMMLVDTTKLKQVLIPSPLKCLEVMGFSLIFQRKKTRITLSLILSCSY